MDLESEVLIVPATATRSLQLAGGPPMEQAVPEDYALAVFVLRALEERNGSELEFLLKAYFPVLVVESSIPNQYFLIELLGISSSKLTPISKTDTSELGSVIESLKTSESIMMCIEDARRAL
ncbi:MAG: hypothetical protein ACFFD9_03155, partial [Candidatus Thorarchaeota archaeon]